MSTTAIRNRKRKEAHAARVQAERDKLKARLQFADVPGFEDHYAAGSDGYIYSKRNWRSLIGGIATGYFQVTLCIPNGLRKQEGVHRIVCKAFHGLPPEGKNDCNHINGCKFDNRPENLEWVSRTDNQRHAADLAMKPTGELSHFAKLTESQVREIRSLIGSMPQSQIAQQFGVSATCISKIATGKKWRQLQ